MLLSAAARMACGCGGPQRKTFSYWLFRDAAVAFASARGWLSIGGVPAHGGLLDRAAP
jgi:hypothetical protein